MKKLLLFIGRPAGDIRRRHLLLRFGRRSREQEKPVDPTLRPTAASTGRKIDPKATVRGVVTCAGAGVQGVVVTDGVNMMRTNKQGAYGLRTSSDKSKLVYPDRPVRIRGRIHARVHPRFYRRISSPRASKVQQHDFTLKRSTTTATS